MSDLQVRQVRSSIGIKPKQRGTLRALGLGRIGKTNTLPDRPEIRGMIARVPHLIEVTEDHCAGGDEAVSEVERLRRYPLPSFQLVISVVAPQARHWSATGVGIWSLVRVAGCLAVPALCANGTAPDTRPASATPGHGAVCSEAPA
jgi:large subunit ribosomal protein L30